MDLIDNSSVDPENHWYFLHKRRWLYRNFNRYGLEESCVWDVGAGVGFFAKGLFKNYPSLQITCIDINYGSSELGIRDGIKYSDQVPIQEKADVLLLMDVIEHVENDKKLMEEYLANSTTGSFWLVTAPAFMRLWSGHDVALKHFRRYSKKSLLELCESLEFEVIECGYLFVPLFPLVFMKRFFSRGIEESNDLKNQKVLVNKALLWTLNLDFIPFINFFPGSTVTAVLKKRDSNAE